MKLLGSPLEAPSIESIVLESIVIGQRRRQKLGNLRGLERSIAEHGLIHPILLRNGNELVAGQRRLEACRRLGWKEIAARRVDGLSDEDLRAIELEENTERLALLDFETSKARLAEIRQAEAAARAEEFRPEPGRKGRPRESGSRRDIAERTGVSRPARDRLERHVALAERYPFMKRDGWAQYRVLEAGEKLDALPPDDRPKAAALLDQDAIPPKTAIQLLGNIAEMPAPKRRRIFDLAKSDDPHDRTTALTEAAKLPPPPDPGLLKLIEAHRLLADAARVCRASGFSGPIETVASTVKNLIEAIRLHHREAGANGVS